eukprot:TRINITY_DN3490_c0_g1_i1.p1 TRINITY_DN3490_c0_g1~~TRINITY_DN3490_c0_g1_i1.p1  ORF type:complete len:266 (-),score=100.10 TRINITY_DN3490_c0_g1_i1:158-955(-)
MFNNTEDAQSFLKDQSEAAFIWSKEKQNKLKQEQEALKEKEEQENQENKEAADDDAGQEDKGLDLDNYLKTDSEMDDGSDDNVIALLEWALFQRGAREHSLRERVDPKEGTILEDSDYLAFVESLNNKEAASSADSNASKENGMTLASDKPSAVVEALNKMSHKKTTKQTAQEGAEKEKEGAKEETTKGTETTTGKQSNNRTTKPTKGQDSNQKEAKQRRRESKQPRPEQLHFLYAFWERKRQQGLWQTARKQWKQSEQQEQQQQ